jgi:hypothetical protein
MERVMSGHTPGPWQVIQDGKWWLVRRPGYKFGPNRQTREAAERACDKENQDWRDNATKAAATDMLTALSALYKAVGESGWQNADPVPSNRAARAKLLNDARDAIAKATGAAS